MATLYYMELVSKQSFDLSVRGINLRSGFPTEVLNSKGEPATETWIKSESCPQLGERFYCPIYDNTPGYSDLSTIESINFLTEQEFNNLT